MVLTAKSVYYSSFSKSPIKNQNTQLTEKSVDITIGIFPDYPIERGWSGGAKVLGKLPVPGRPTYLDYSRARACCACSRCGWGLFGHFFSHLSCLSFFSLSLGDFPI